MKKYILKILIIILLLTPFSVSVSVFADQILDCEQTGTGEVCTTPDGGGGGSTSGTPSVPTPSKFNLTVSTDDVLGVTQTTATCEVMEVSLIYQDALHLQ